jgi:hypothetical protein
VLAAPQHGIVFLAMTKCASTAIEDELFSYSQLVTRKNPMLKHMHYRAFKRFIEPLLGRHGHPRDTYEVVCVMREPISWLHSWWRYRGRPQLANAEGPRRRNYTGDITFEQFVRAYIDQSERYATSIGRQANFVRGPKDQLVGVDRLFRYEELGAFVDYASERVGKRLALDKINVSPKTRLKLPRSTRRELQEFLATEYYIYETLANGQYIDIPVPEDVDLDDDDDDDDDDIDVTDGADDAETDEEAAKDTSSRTRNGSGPRPADAPVPVPLTADGLADTSRTPINGRAQQPPRQRLRSGAVVSG